MVFLSIAARLILAGLALADSDTCCLVDALSNLGSYFPLHDLPSQIAGFFYALSSLKILLTVLSGMLLLV